MLPRCLRAFNPNKFFTGTGDEGALFQIERLTGFPVQKVALEKLSQLWAIRREYGVKAIGTVCRLTMHDVTIGAIAVQRTIQGRRGFYITMFNSRLPAVFGGKVGCRCLLSMIIIRAPRNALRGGNGCISIGIRHRC